LAGSSRKPELEEVTGLTLLRNDDALAVSLPQDDVCLSNTEGRNTNLFGVKPPPPNPLSDPLSVTVVLCDDRDAVANGLFLTLMPSPLDNGMEHSVLWGVPPKLAGEKALGRRTFDGPNRIDESLVFVSVAPFS